LVPGPHRQPRRSGRHRRHHQGHHHRRPALAQGERHGEEVRDDDAPARRGRRERRPPGARVQGSFPGGESGDGILRGRDDAARRVEAADPVVRRSLQARDEDHRRQEVTMRSLGIAAIVAALSAPAFALKYAAPEHKLAVDPAISSWKPSELTVAPEEELNLVGADVMDEITLGWVRLFRKAYPRLSVTMEARASGTGGPALTEGRAHLAPVGRELLPAEEKAFVDKFGYKPLAIKVATGSVGSLGKTATSVIFVDKDNPLAGITMEQLDAIYSKTRKRGHADIRTWGDLGAKGEWTDRPIHLYGLKPVNGIEQFLKQRVLLDGEYRDGIEFVKGKGFTHAFTVAADDMAHKPGGLTYALLSNVTPNVKVLPIAPKEGAPYV